MRRTRVKICGVMRPEDAALAADCGADAVGVILHATSPRNVSLETAARIISALPPLVTPVGLFVDSSAEHVLQVSRRLGLRHVQLHGDETPELIAKLTGLVIIKAVRVIPEKFVESLNVFRGSAGVRGIVLETGGTSTPGGTGIANNWKLIQDSAAAGVFDGLPPIIAAGGLTPETVGDVVGLLRPWAVDVSSGVEKVRGEKSEQLMREFIEAVDRAEHLP